MDTEGALELDKPTCEFKIIVDTNQLEFNVSIYQIGVLVLEIVNNITIKASRSSTKYNVI